MHIVILKNLITATTVISNSLTWDLTVLITIAPTNLVALLVMAFAVAVLGSCWPARLLVLLFKYL